MKKSTLMITTLLVVGILGVGFATAYGNGMMNGMDEENKEFMQETRDSIKMALEEGNYDDWEYYMNEKLSFMKERINPEEFAKIGQRHLEREEFRTEMQALKESGEWTKEDIEALKAEYGIEGKQKGFGKGKGHMKGHGNGSCPHLEN